MAMAMAALRIILTLVLLHCVVGEDIQSATCSYNIVVKTGCVDNAGTDANVNVEFFNRDGSSALITDLDNPGDDFERCDTNTFTRNADCLYDICKMRLEHDNSGSKPGWYVDFVSVHLTATSQTVTFPVNQWLALDEPPYSLSVTIDKCDSFLAAVV